MVQAIVADLEHPIPPTSRLAAGLLQLRPTPPAPAAVFKPVGIKLPKPMSPRSKESVMQCIRVSYVSHVRRIAEPTPPSQTRKHDTPSIRKLTTHILFGKFISPSSKPREASTLESRLRVGTHFFFFAHEVFLLGLRKRLLSMGSNKPLP